MKFFAVLGRQPELGLAELQSVYGKDAVQAFGEGALLPEKPAVHRLGGTIKAGVILGRAPFWGLKSLPVDADLLPLQDAKTNFGVSIYGPKIKPQDVRSYGLQLKKELRQRGSIRLVTADKTNLSAAQLKFNQIPDKGFELVILLNKGEAIWGLTSEYQDIDAYSLRDHGRPARSAKVGMLPPKLAQILVNLSGGEKIYDPFCGTGVILQEALLMGKPAKGSDIEPKMTAYTQTNLEWLMKTVTHPLPEWQSETLDARDAVIPAGYSIASEGYLGPNLTSPPDEKTLAPIKQKIAQLYLDSFKQWSKSLESGRIASICLPAWRQKNNFIHLDIIDDLERLGYTRIQFASTSGPLLYARPQQVVAREIITLRKN